MSVWSDAVAALSPHAWYRHAEASGTTLTDSSGGGRNGVYANTGDITYAQPSLVPGGTDNNSVLFAGAAFYNITSGLSFNRTNVTYVTTMATTTTGVGTGGLFYVNTNTRLSWTSTATTVRINATVVDLGYVPTPMLNGSAHLIVLVVATTSVQLWVDGTKVADVAHAATGGTQSTLRTNNLVGAFDETLLFTSNLTSVQIGDLWSAWQGGPAPLTVELTGTHPRDTSAFTLATRADISMSAQQQRDTAAFDLNTVPDEVDLALSANHPRDTSAFTLDAGPMLTLAGTHPRDTAAFALDLSKTLTLAGTHRRDTAAFALTIPPILALAGTHPRDTAAFALAKPPGTDTRTQSGGRHRSGLGVATWEPPVVVPDASPLLVHNYDKARAFTAPVMVGTRPTYSVAEVVAPAHRTRILVGGKDISFFRGVPTPAPSYRLIEPLDFGAGTLELPQVSPAFEVLGTGALKWLRKGKTVKVQRVDTTTGAVVATDYIGFITDFSVRGNTLVCDLGGMVAGRAALRDRQPVLFRQIKDVGNWVYSAVTQSAGVKFTPRLGPVTGIELASRGGTSMLDYISELLALSVHQSGAQWTVGRRANGTWGMWLKDTTTIDATIYLDDARMVGDLHQSLAEEPNRIFVTCVSPDGRRIKFGAYPGFKQGDPPPYPFTAGTPFGEGTTNGDTDTGDGITVMLNHMVTVSYLTPTQNDGAFDAQVTRAIKRLQDDAGLTESGIMNPATWDALYDLSATSYSIANARILPAAQRPSVKPWNLTSSGAISSRNPNFDRTVEVVDRTVNLGPGFTVQQARQYARDLLREANTPNWVGTIRCELAAWVGEHNPGEALPALMPAKDIRPGMNVWLPTFQGGMLFHVSGAEHPANGGAPVLTVDTRARDTMAAWEAITRNRESRSNPARMWLNNHRQSDITKDAFVEFDEVSGILDDSVRLESGWNVFPVKAGQAGTLQKLRIHTTGNPTRFAVLVTTRPVTVSKLNARNPQPLTVAGTEKWDKPAIRTWLDERGMIYQAGSDDQPCGYWPGAQTGEDGELTGDAITGKWEDDAGVGWHTFAEPVLYVAMFVLSDCRIPAGRIMWNQLEAGA